MCVANRGVLIDWVDKRKVGDTVLMYRVSPT